MLDYTEVIVLVLHLVSAADVVLLLLLLLLLLGVLLTGVLLIAATAFIRFADRADLLQRRENK